MKNNDTQHALMESLTIFYPQSVGKVEFDKEFKFVARWVLALRAENEPEDGNIIFDDASGNKISLNEINPDYVFNSGVWMPLYCKKIYSEGTPWKEMYYGK